MPAPDNSPQQVLVTHATLAGLTPLIPIPLLDDLFYRHFLRSLVKRLAATHARELSPQEIEILTAQKGRGCALGCLGTVLLYPIKKVLRKIFFFLEWKRAADTISHTYYFGYLIEAALEEGWIETHGADRVRAAIDDVLARTNTSLITRAASGVVGQSKGVLQSLGQLLLRNLPNAGGRAGEAEVSQASAAVEDEDRLRGFVNRLQSAIAALPAEHFQQLRGELARELERL
ncbi:MAG: hypothetical protein KY445_10470 [Armatimonadetes bacterium]|nr:hypothetical protein [Armatimonadota bacterium]